MVDSSSQGFPDPSRLWHIDADPVAGGVHFISLQATVGVGLAANARPRSPTAHEAEH
jgi:hypothetical protein